MVLAVGAVIKLAFLVVHTGAPDFEHPWLDAGYHDWVARGFAGEGWDVPSDVADPRVDETPWARPPLYPAALAAVYSVSSWLGGTGRTAARVLQLLLGLLAAALAARLARRLRPDDEHVGPLAALLVVLSPTLLYFEGELVAAAPAACALIGLVLASLWAREALDLKRAAAVGALFALCIHLRPNFMLLAPIVGVALAWRPAHQLGGDDVGSPTSPPNRFTLPPALAALGLAALLVLPVGIRNQSVSGSWVLLSTNGPITLLHGNHDEADGFTMSLPPLPALAGVQEMSPFSYSDLVVHLGAKLGRPELTAADAGGWFQGQATSWIASHPGAFAGLLARKSLLLLGPAEVSNNKQVALEMQANAVTRLLPGRWWLLLCFGFGGIASWGLTSWRRRREAIHAPRWDAGWIAIATTFIALGSLVPFLAASRFRAPVVPIVAAFAAVGVLGLWEAIQARAEAQGKRRLVALASVVLLSAAGLAFNWIGYAPDAAQWRLDRSRAHLRAQKIDAASAELEAGLAEQPRHPGLLVSAGYLDAIQGRFGPAERRFRAALAQDPDHLQARAQLGATLVGQRREAEAVALLEVVVAASPTDVKSRYNLALALSALGRTQDAVLHLEEVLRQKPSLLPARQALQRMQPSSSRRSP